MKVQLLAFIWQSIANLLSILHYKFNRKVPLPRILMKRAQSLVESETLKIKMCKIAAEGQGYQPKDIHGFVEMVPMGDAEIIRLQFEEKHAYMQ